MALKNTVEDDPSVWEPDGNLQVKFLAPGFSLAQPAPWCCGHLGSKPVHGRSLSLPLCNFNFKMSEQILKANKNSFFKSLLLLVIHLYACHLSLMLFNLFM